MTSHCATDIRVFSQSFPHIFDSIILFSDTETHAALRLTCQLVCRHVDALKCHQLRGTIWQFMGVGSLMGVYVEDYSNEGDDFDVQTAIYHWKDQSMRLPGLKAAQMIYVHDPPAPPMEVLSQRTSPSVYVYLYHTRQQAYCPLDNCRRAFIEVNPFKCSCDPARPIDYRLRAPEVRINLWAVGPDPPSAQGRFPILRLGNEENLRRITTPRNTSPTSCNLLNQVLHPDLRWLTLACPLSVLHCDVPALLLPKPTGRFKLPEAFRLKIQVDYGNDTSSDNALEIKKAFAEHLGVTKAQVMMQQ